MIIAVWLLAAFVVSLGLVPLSRGLAVRFNFVAVPREDRWHLRPIAMSGGVALAMVVFGGAALGGLMGRIPLLLGAAAVTFLVGLSDDILRLKPATKLVAQIAVASILLAGGYRLNWVTSLTLDTLLTAVWIVGITNAFNLLDNMDGLCGGIALITGFTLLLDLLPSVTPGAPAFFEARYLALLLGATSGFLVYNVPPASIFLGDSGSLLIGLSFAALTLSARHETGGRSDVFTIAAVPVVTLLIPIADTTLVTVSRWVSGRSASEGGRDHSSHRLVAIGLSEKVAVIVLCGLGAIGGGIALVMRHYATAWSIPLAAGFVLFLTIFAVYLGRIRVYSEDEVRAHRPGAFTPVLVEMMHKRRVAEVLLDFCLIVLAYYAAYRLKFEGVDYVANFANMYRSLPFVVSVQLIAFFVAGAYGGVWRYFGLLDAVVMVRGVLLGVVSTIVVLLLAAPSAGYSRAVFAIYAVLLLILVTSSRASFRLIGEFLHRRRDLTERLIIYGAGDDGAMALRELRLLDHAYRVVGFVDDEPEQFRTRVHGYPVLGGFNYLVDRLEARAVDAVVISCRTPTADRLRRIEQLCAAATIPLYRLSIDLRQVLTSPERQNRVAVLRPKRSSSDG